MSDDPSIPDDQADYSEIGSLLAKGFIQALSTGGVQKATVSTGVNIVADAWALVIKTLQAGAFGVGKTLVGLEEVLTPVLVPFLVPIIANLFGTEVNASAFLDKHNRGGREATARVIVDQVMSAIAGGAGGTTEPSSEGAKRIATASVHAAMEGWFNGTIIEMIGDCSPFECLHFTDLAGLGEDVTRAIGLGRLVRRALSPLIDATCATPMQWATHKTYRPTLLPASTVVRQFMRGKWDWPDVNEELARQGYSDERIDALVNEQRKFFGAADVRQFVSRGYWSNDQGLQHLRDQGYDDPMASDLLRLEGLKEIEGIEEREADAIISAYAELDIDRATMLAMMGTAVTVELRRNLLIELADVRFALAQYKLANTFKGLSHGELEDAVLAGFITHADYREALRQQHYSEPAIDVLDLLLRKREDDRAHAEQIKAQLAAERAAEKAARAAEAAARRAKVAADEALRRRGAIADLERAVIRGLIPIARLEEVLGAQYDADTVALLVETVEQQRQDYIDAQNRRAQAIARAAHRSIDVGALESAVLENILTIEDFRARLVALTFTPDDVQVLTATLAQHKADLDAARAKRAAAEEAAKHKHIDLGRFEQLVRRGARPVADYDALLTSLGFDEASRAAMDVLLTAQFADDARARQLRAAAQFQRDNQGVTLGQIRRAVILAIRPIGAFQQWLIDQKYTADAQAILLAELRADLGEADAARQRRVEADSTTDARALSVSALARAARLGLVTPDAYQARLVALGFSPDDIASDTELLTSEIADVQTARTTAAAADAAAPLGGPTLAQLARDVQAGAAHVEDYRARAVALNLSPDTVTALVRVLNEELAARRDVAGQRATIGAQLAGGANSLSDLEQQVRAGALTIGGFQQTLTARGIEATDAQLLGGALADQIGA